MSTFNLCFDQKYEKYPNFYLKIFIFWWLKCSVYLNGRVFVMTSALQFLFLHENIYCGYSLWGNHMNIHNRWFCVKTATDMALFSTEKYLYFFLICPWEYTLWYSSDEVHFDTSNEYHNICICEEIEMYQYATDAAAHWHPGAIITRNQAFCKQWSWKRAIIHTIIGWFYPKSNST